MLVNVLTGRLKQASENVVKEFPSYRFTSLIRLDLHTKLLWAT